MIETGSQVKAARALLGWSQSTLADRAGLHVNSVKYWEARFKRKRREEAGLRQMREALEGEGVEFIAGGVRLTSLAA